MKQTTKSHHRIAGTSRLGTLLGILLLLGLGFFFGLVTGAMWQEPRLVASFVAGNTTDVSLEALESVERLPTVALESAEPPTRPLGVRRDVEPPLADRAEPVDPIPAPEEPRVSAAPPPQPRPEPPAREEIRDGFSIQVGAFAERQAAVALADTLRSAGLTVYVASGDGPARWRVRVGPFGTRAEAERRSRRIQADHQLPTWVMAESSP